MEQVRRVSLPRWAPGIDWGAPRRLIAAKRDNSITLFIREGFYSPAAGVRGFGRVYQTPKLILNRSGFYDPLNLAEGRISGGTLRALAGKIDAAFGRPGLTEALSLSKTTYID